MHFFHYIGKILLSTWNLILHLDEHINLWVQLLGPSVYLLVFFIIFCETGLVIAPFLPGDSLLFALGALTASENAALSFPILFVLLSVAGILGGVLNYWIGGVVGPKVFNKESKWFRQSYLLKTKDFYERHGGKTIVFARFIPIIRTFAPFIAGIGRMKYARFFLFNLFGGVGWVFILLTLGHHFGNMPIVKKNFGIVIPGIIVISIAPILLEFISRMRDKPEKSKKAQNE